MASFETIAFISAIKYLPNSVLVFLDEFHKGYKKADGSVVEDKYLSYKTIWKPYFKKYFAKNFGNGMLVQVKGEMLPYAVEQDKIIEGYTIVGQVMNIASYPRNALKREIQMIKDSQSHSTSTPNLDGYLDDF